MESISKTQPLLIEKKKRKFPWQQFLPWLIPVGLIGIWQLASSIGWLSSDTLPSPVAVIQDGIALSQTGELQKNISISLYRAIVGFAIGGTAGFLLGFINGVSKISRSLTDTTVQMLRNIPHLSLIPLVIIVIGIGESAKISLVAIGVMFPIYINTLHGIRSVDPELIEMGKSYGLSRFQLLKKIILPGAMPTILMGVRYALGVMWTTLIVAETIASDSGIGYMSTNAEEFMDMKTILLCIFIYALLGKLSDLIAKGLESYMLDWRNAKGREMND
ncbi:Alkanesulfonates transport system permease protein [Pediococcus damnosus]|uniref:Alkanesulfonates transport system permease protein n=1 Tax=Pediococcus damnosus TaxID=51663 RepID=A0A143AHC4_9LACO|nr:ABC transporter permease subunit [Pediococcus damnosus]AMV63630.1 Alkanesulfonates transport system permease protein [Pediococcus damnosus]AMV66429.1 Alkanesulfonates transport system permease protein [Pediococcus damnosus]AMV68731.1 Alkanesulfonates transport system permease protein [Pediococcus damnosus]KJU73268.1 ABC transporter permease [Pediococcus damnosus LMG 28219]PIO80545.1 ABC transporter permease [Pediococcus damnosus]